MELVLDTADTKVIRQMSQMLAISGVTTNPKIVAATGKQPREVADEVLSVLDDDQNFFMQVTSTDYDGMMRDAHAICSLREDHMYAKIPCTPDGLRAIKDCKAEGLGILGTVVMSPEQGFLAALNGADYLAPYVNRMSNYSVDGVDATGDLVGMLRTHGLKTKVLGASWHNVAQVRELIELGIDAVTLPPALLRSMFTNAATKDIVDDFSSAWQAAYGRTGFDE